MRKKRKIQLDRENTVDTFLTSLLTLIFCLTTCRQTITHTNTHTHRYKHDYGLTKHHTLFPSPSLPASPVLPAGAPFSLHSHRHEADTNVTLWKIITNKRTADCKQLAPLSGLSLVISLNPGRGRDQRAQAGRGGEEGGWRGEGAAAAVWRRRKLKEVEGRADRWDTNNLLSSCKTCKTVL